MIFFMFIFGDHLNSSWDMPEKPEKKKKKKERSWEKLYSKIKVIYGLILLVSDRSWWSLSNKLQNRDNIRVSLGEIKKAQSGV